MKTTPLTLTTIQKYETHENREDLPIEAIVASRNGSDYITFTQQLPDSPLKIQNMVKVKNGIVYAKRTGALSSNITFDLARPCLTSYETPYGLFDIKITTESIDWEILQNVINLEIKYEMVMQGRKVSDNIYRITSVK